uniref:Uncharacterized protein n=1 Tax=Ditylenchus dipsaci TaxID=166011 RepID=A0A915CMR5_9BILA
MGTRTELNEKSNCNSISQIQFIQLWKTVAGTLLLQLGETQKNFMRKVEKEIEDAIDTHEIQLYSEDEEESKQPASEPTLGEFFDYRVSLKDIAEQYRKRNSSFM